jgi:high-affinity iron transporter
MRKGGQDQELKPLWLGAGLAVLASVAAAVVFQLWFGGAHNDAMEAVVMIVAAALMLYMSGWLFLKQDPREWKRMIDASAKHALSSGAAFTLGSISFLAVFREGAETALFLHALASTSGGWGPALLMGLAGAVVCLAAIYAAMQWLALRIPLRPLFIVTSAFLFVMGLRFVGGAIQEMQEQQVVPYDSAPTPDWFASLGFNPTWEAIGAQLVIALVALVSIAIAMRPSSSGAAQAH